VEKDRLPADLVVPDSGSRVALPQAVPAVATPQEREAKAIPVAVEAIDIPDLEVEEIVYHQLATSRLAVINDLPVMEGTDIDGARVEEILVDRVRFSFRGVRFDKFLPETGN
jgi:general secretion pathway protein B